MRALGYEDYDRHSEAGLLVPVYRELPADLLTPVSAFLAVGAERRQGFLFESVLGGEHVARYSFLGRDPGSTLFVRDGRVVAREGGAERTLPEALPAALRARLPRAAEVPGLPRLTGGAVGYLAYDAARLFERLPDRHRAARGVLASFAFYRSLVAFDHARQRLILIADAEPGRRAAFERTQEVLDGLEQDLRRAPREGGPAPRPRGAAPDRFHDGPAFRAAVAVAQEHIARGDVFQVVLSRQQHVPCAADPFAVYRALRMVNPSPYMYFLRDGEEAVAGSSPEMLVRVEGDRAEMRPIAGTRPRGEGDEDDRRLGAELCADEKERAEHLMLVDLGRNDLGRVCRFDSVAVPELMTVERYSHVMHLVSAVRGQLREGRDALDALVAAFPAGTLTGAPKIRAMEIIDALEPAPRGLYGGAIGYLDLRGNLDFCIAIRTLSFRGGDAVVQAGAGIVADSDPAAEDRETEAKAGALREALAMAEELFGGGGAPA
jgi:anthranilate synthase component 1